MKLYSKNHDVVDTDNYTYFDNGSCATVYINGKTMLKVYNNDCRYYYYLSKRMFKLLKTLNIPNIVRLKEFYFQYTDKFSLKLPMDAYTMDYVEKSNTNFIDLNIEELTNVLNKLDKTVKILSRNKIVLRDLHAKNIILSDEGFVIIDPDLFFRSPISSKQAIYRVNKKIVLECLTTVIRSEYAQKNNSGLIIFHLDDRRSIPNSVLSITDNASIYESIKKLH